MSYSDLLPTSHYPNNNLYKQKNREEKQADPSAATTSKS